MVAILWSMGKGEEGHEVAFPTNSRTLFSRRLFPPFPHSSTCSQSLSENYGCVTSTTPAPSVALVRVAENDNFIQSVSFLSSALVQES